MNAPIVINNVAIRTNADGLYRLNDIHAGSPVADQDHKKPSKWALGPGAEIINAAEIQSAKKHSGTKSKTYEVINGGSYQGTYASKDLVYAYAMWLSPEFMLHVIRVFDAVVTQTPQPVPVVPLSRLQDAIGTAMLIMNAVPGVNPAIAAAAALTMIKDHTGIDTEPMRKCLPALQGPVCSLNATAVGARLGMSAKHANLALMDAGLQVRNARGEWELTEAGKQYGEHMPYASNGHAGYQVLWSEPVFDRLHGQ